MGENQKLVQYQWFDQQVKAGRYPNATTLAQQFEVVTKTAQRAIDYMRDQLNAPLQYNSTRKGYFYTDNTFVLPASEPTQEEMLAILLAQNILANSAQGVISQQIKSFGRKLFGKNGLFGVTEKRFREAFSSSWNEYAPAQGQVFKTVMKALIENRLLTFIYTSPRDQQPKERTVEPHHLQHYMGSWGVIAFCHLRGEWRSFMLSRMRDVEMKSDTFVPKPRSQWKNQMEGGFGIFQGGQLILVRLHFNPFRAPWIREQIWHKDQQIEELNDGSLILSFPVCQFHEVKMRILQYGGDVVVLEPEKLKQEVLEGARVICRNYDENIF
ncbi:YafY family protein [Geobacter sp. DSM 9736]|uniref:helix-turn-helix transcriptional regulator n=1 Tax=Geobacter sp. DSM 9736 TaxID=1277350 RepID=UPI000B50B4F3|nr:WYL domain-containing protein [Geobacter sp. DSM 9736]SNB45457.1 Predicted DNA-binding transcriptional regulator YafY, contains an HTH and WYL domains [Geobacter sp. DSM 9736]